MSDPLAYPLDWPADVPRRDQPERNYRFGKGTERGLTLTRATDEVLAELRRLNVPEHSIVISTNLKVRLDGLPRAGQRKPDDCAVCVYWRKNDVPFALPCDAWDRIEHNLHAIALHLAALRGLDRWGCGTSSQAYAGYKALPPPIEPNSDPDWTDYFGVERDHVCLEEIQAEFRSSAKTMHPDRGGSANEFARLVRMRDLAVKELSQ